MDFALGVNDFLLICTSISVIWGAIKVIKEIRKPHEDLKNQVHTNTEHLNSDIQRLDDIERGQKMLMNSVIILMDHIISGNSIDKLKEARDKMKDFLINK